MAETVACIGTGNVGRSWAIVFARAGRSVTLWDAVPSAAERAAGLIADALADVATPGSVRIGATLADALDGATHVQESIAERPDVKRRLFAEVDRLADSAAVLASSTSAIPASLLFEALPGRARCLIAHPVNPPHLIPLVELSGAPFTARETVERARMLMSAVGQSPVVLRREVPGFLLNRLQWALLGEALHLVGEGYCDAADIDAVVTAGLARRWALMGPFTVGHLNADTGIAGYFGSLADAMSRVRESLRVDYPPTADLIDLLAGAMASVQPDQPMIVRQRDRDQRIAALRRFLEDDRQRV